MKIINQKITEHFTTDEMSCKCGCGLCEMETDFMSMLEKLRTKIGKPIIVTSGRRCPSHSVAVGGYANDAHVRGFAADIMVNGLTSYDIAEMAELCGFTGIGIINGKAVHVDNRNTSKYPNGHWFGNEMTGDDNIKTFVRKTNSKESVTITLGGKKYVIKEV